MTHIKRIDEMVAVNEGQPIHLRGVNRPFDPQDNNLTRARDSRPERAEKIRTAKQLEGFKNTLAEYARAMVTLEDLDSELIRAKKGNHRYGYQYFKNFDAIKRIPEADSDNTWMSVSFEDAENFNEKVSFYNEHGREMSSYVRGLNSIMKSMSVVDDYFIAYEGEVIYDDEIVTFSPSQFEDDEYPNIIKIFVDLSEFRGLPKLISSKGFDTCEIDGVSIIEMNVNDVRELSKVVKGYLKKY